MHGCLSPVSVVFCQVEVSAIGRSLVQKNPIECGVSVIEKFRRGVPGPLGLSSHEGEKSIFFRPSDIYYSKYKEYFCGTVMVIQ